MTSSAREGNRILGTLGESGGLGVVRMQDRFDTDADDLWSALTDPSRLARWIGEFTGELRVDGESRGHFFVSDWEGTVRVEVCDPPVRLRVLIKQDHETQWQTIEATLSPDGDQTVLVVEQRGMPVDHVAAYGAGIQVHVEDLGAHLAGGDRVHAERWEELEPDYQALAERLAAS